MSLFPTWKQRACSIKSCCFGEHVVQCCVTCGKGAELLVCAAHTCLLLGCSIPEMLLPIGRFGGMHAMQTPIQATLPFCRQPCWLSDVSISALSCGCCSKDKNRVAKNPDAADHTDSHIRAALPLRAGSHHLLLMPGRGSKWMSSKHSRVLPQPFRQK